MRAGIRWAWTQITSMRTALLLLFLLALTAIPGSFIPQQSVTPIRVSDFAKAHPLLDRIYRPLGFYHVYTSPWFSAVYLLLFVSLIGCIVPRIAVYTRALRTPPPRMPSRLDRLPESASHPVGPQTDAVESAAAWLRRNRYRVVRRDAAGVAGLSAERGYLREFGNLVFHLSAVFVLLGVAVTNLYGYKGTSQVVVGEGFSNTITQYDEFHAGPLVNIDRLNPFTLILKSFQVAFETGPVQTGAARKFDAVVQVNTDGSTTTRHLQVNDPLTIDGTKVHLLAQGYAVHVTVRDGQGNVAFSGPVVFQPVDSNFRSLGVVKVPDARPQRLAFQGFFLPTAVIDAQQGPHSVFPDALKPELFLNVWSGPPATETGVPENVFTLNTTGLTQVRNGNDLLRLKLTPGSNYTLPNGLGSITFDGWTRWAQLQISRTPGLWLTVGSIAAAVLGLCLSLFVRPRRLWIRLIPRGDGTMLADAGGLDRADARTGLSDDVRALVAAATGADPEAIEVRSRGWADPATPPRTLAERQSSETASEIKAPDVDSSDINTSDINSSDINSSDTVQEEAHK